MFERLADQDFAYLTTFGRRTGKAHTVEVWFGLDDRRVYMLSGGGDRADWVRNLRKTPRVRVRAGTRTVTGAARVVRGGTTEDERAGDPRRQVPGVARGETSLQLGEERASERDSASLAQRASGQYTAVRVAVSVL